MAELITIIFFIGIWVVCKINAERKLDNYDISKIDTAKLNRDMVNGVSVSERRRRCINGYYDKK